MKKFIIPLFAILFFLTSCEVINQLVPDVDSVVTVSYTIPIDENLPTGVSDTTLVDITEYPEYQDYSQYVTGYELEKITYEITDYDDAPEDLYFEGSIIAEDSIASTTVVVADIELVKLLDLANNEGTTDMLLDEAGKDQLLDWLDDPGTFNAHFEFGFKNEDGTDYNFDPEDLGSSFKVKVNYHLVIITGL